jgi:uncharacterized protein with PIN domain
LKSFDSLQHLEAYFRFHGDLEALVHEKFSRGKTGYHFQGSPGVKDVIEAMGVPHTEVDVILANGKSVTFEYQLKGLDDIQLFPPGANCAEKKRHHLCSKPIGSVAFIADVHLGSLARKLRLLGFDTLYQNDIDDRELIERGVFEDRVILTKDRGVLKHKRVNYGYLVRGLKLNTQVLEVLRRYDLYHQIHLFARCTVCNNFLEEVSKPVIAHLLKPNTKKYFDQFHLCKGCQRIYWKGSHFNQINEWANALLRQVVGK